MSRATPPMRDLAERLLDCETREIKSSATIILIAAPVCEKLRPHLATLMGRAGFRALLAHALARAEKNVPLLRAVRVNAEGALERSGESAAKFDRVKSVEGSVALLAHVLDLLVAFIGENLTLRLVCDILPTLVLNEWDFNKRDSE